jgi:hypothetical protein
MLHEFLTWNRAELIKRCRAKVSQRPLPSATPLELEHGVPLFLDQLIQALRHEQENPAMRNAAMTAAARSTPAFLESSRTSALHGKEQLQQGYSVDQVVHGYGDVCQAITELAKERTAEVTIDEFHTFNRVLDKAIADAVTSYVHHRDESISAQGAADLHERMGALADEQRKLLDTALRALDALKVGNIGLKGATGGVLEESLIELRKLIDKSLPEIRLATGMVQSPNG